MGPLNNLPKRRKWKIDLGSKGEDVACRFLMEKGYRILERNVRMGRGEIDIVAREGGEIVFVEVKTRTTTRMGTPAEAVGPRKQEQLRRLALLYLKSRSIGETPCRFDVATIILPGTGEKPEIEIIKGAF